MAVLKHLPNYILNVTGYFIMVGCDGVEKEGSTNRRKNPLPIYMSMEHSHVLGEDHLILRFSGFSRAIFESRGTVK